MGASTISTDKRDIACQAIGRAKGWPGLIVLLVVASLAFFLRLGNFGVIDGSESYYPAAVREMVEAHSYLVPQMNYQVYFSKPIMTFWLLSSAYHLFGVNAFAGRFFGAFFGVLLTLSIYGVTRAIRGNKAGMLAGLFFAGSPFVLEYFRVSSVDAFFTTFLGFAFCALLAVVSAGRLRWWPAIYVALGLAVLTKGPAAVVLFGAGCLLSLIALRPKWSTIRFWFNNLHPFKGTATLLAVAAPWYIAVGVATKWLFLKVFFVYENLGRLNGHTNMRASYWWRYPAVVFAGLLPWSLLLPAVFADAVKSRLGSPLGQNIETGVDGRGTVGGEATVAGAPSTALLDAKIVSVCWALGVILLFSISKTQMEPYILPAVAPLAIAAALYAEQWSRADRGFGRWMLEKCSMLALFAGPLLAIGLTIAAVAVKDSSLPVWARFVIPAIAWITAVIWILQRKFVRQDRVLDGAIAIALSASILFTSLVAGAMEYWYTKKFADLHYLCAVLRTTNGEVGLFGSYRPSVFYYVQRPVNCFYQAHWLEKQPGTNNFVYVLCRQSDLHQLESESGVALATYTTRGEWGIYRADNAYLKPYATLWQTFSTLSIPDILTDRYHLGVLTDCLSGGPLWKGK